MGLGQSKNDDTEIELESEFTVFCFDDAKPEIKIVLKGDSVPVETILAKVGKQLGLQPSSLKFFAIFQGLHTPIKKFKPAELVSIESQGLSIQKWCFDLEEEKEGLMSDAAALYIASIQTKAEIELGHFVLSEEQIYALSELEEPSFLQSKPYLEFCHTLPDYNSIKLQHCQLQQEFVIGSFKASPGTICGLRATKRGLILTFDLVDYFISWRKIKRWTKADLDMFVTYTVYSVADDSFSSLMIESPQAPYLVSVTLDMIKVLQKELGNIAFQTSDLIRNNKGEVVEWCNVTFSSSRYNAEIEIGSKYKDLSNLSVSDCSNSTTGSNNNVPEDISSIEGSCSLVTNQAATSNGSLQTENDLSVNKNSPSVAEDGSLVTSNNPLLVGSGPSVTENGLPAAGDGPSETGNDPSYMEDGRSVVNNGSSLTDSGSLVMGNGSPITGENTSEENYVVSNNNEEEEIIDEAEQSKPSVPEIKIIDPNGILQ